MKRSTAVQLLELRDSYHREWRRLAAINCYQEGPKGDIESEKDRTLRDASQRIAKDLDKLILNELVSEDDL